MFSQVLLLIGAQTLVMQTHIPEMGHQFWWRNCELPHPWIQHVLLYFLMESVTSVKLPLPPLLPLPSLLLTNSFLFLLVLILHKTTLDQAPGNRRTRRGRDQNSLRGGSALALQPASARFQRRSHLHHKISP